MNVDEYRVQLDAFSGPLDLLLFLIRRDEVDLYDIPISQITAQYCQTVRLLEVVDPNSVGDFLVLAATLMEVKSRMLLPKPPPEEGEEEEDPRLELVRQLLEYKQYKDAAGELAEKARQRAMRYGRVPLRVGSSAEIELDDVPVWELLEAFGRLMTATGRSLLAHEVVFDDTPVALHTADLLDRLEREPSLALTVVFAGRSRSECIGLFLALLEMIRRRQVRVAQDEPMGEIYLHVLPRSEWLATEPAEIKEPAEAEDPELTTAWTDEPIETADAEPEPADEGDLPGVAPPADVVEPCQETENP